MSLHTGTKTGPYIPLGHRKDRKKREHAPFAPSGSSFSNMLRQYRKEQQLQTMQTKDVIEEPHLSDDRMRLLQEKEKAWIKKEMRSALRIWLCSVVERKDMELKEYLDQDRLKHLSSLGIEASDLDEEVWFPGAFDPPTSEIAKLPFEERKERLIRKVVVAIRRMKEMEDEEQKQQEEEEQCLDERRVRQEQERARHLEEPIARRAAKDRRQSDTGREVLPAQNTSNGGCHPEQEVIDAAPSSSSIEGHSGQVLYAETAQSTAPSTVPAVSAPFPTKERIDSTEECLHLHERPTAKPRNERPPVSPPPLPTFSSDDVHPADTRRDMGRATSAAIRCQESEHTNVPDSQSSTVVKVENVSSAEALKLLAVPNPHPATPERIEFQSSNGVPQYPYAMENAALNEVYTRPVAQVVALEDTETIQEEKAAGIRSLPPSHSPPYSSSEHVPANFQTASLPSLASCNGTGLSVEDKLLCAIREYVRQHELHARTFEEILENENAEPEEDEEDDEDEENGKAKDQGPPLTVSIRRPRTSVAVEYLAMDISFEADEEMMEGITTSSFGSQFGEGNMSILQGLVNAPTSRFNAQDAVTERMTIDGEDEDGDVWMVTEADIEEAMEVC